MGKFPTSRFIFTARSQPHSSGRSKPKALRSVHGTYLRCHPGGDGSAVDLQKSAGPWESFVIEKDGDALQVHLRSFHGSYLCAYPGCNFINLYSLEQVREARLICKQEEESPHNGLLLLTRTGLKDIPSNLAMELT